MKIENFHRSLRTSLQMLETMQKLLRRCLVSWKMYKLYHKRPKTFLIKIAKFS